MRRFLIALFYWTAVFGLAAAELQTVSGNFAAKLPDDLGHALPILEFLRNFERTVRLQGRFDSGGDTRELLIELDPRLAPGEYRWEAFDRRRMILKLDADYPNWRRHRALGRALGNALIRSRMNFAPEQDEPGWPNWPADALWEEFLVRSELDLQLLRFTWLPGLRHIAEPGGALGLNAANLTGQDERNLGRAAFALYLERARLTLEINRRLSAGKQNLLKDYLDLIHRRTLPPDAGFNQVFGTAALQKTAGWAGGAPDNAAEAVKTATALELFGERQLFNVYAPLSSRGVQYRLRQIATVEYQREKDGLPITAALEDLPFLVEKYERCVKLPRQKIAELNRLAAISPAELRGEIFALTATLANIGLIAVPEASAAIKNALEALRNKIARLGRIDAFLDYYEEQSTPLLYPERFVLDPALRRGPLPERLRQMLDQTER